MARQLQKLRDTTLVEVHESVGAHREFGRQPDTTNYVRG